MKPIYKPKGAAKEYGDLALNIYTGCPHRCFYCFAPNVLHKDRETFHSYVCAVLDCKSKLHEVYNTHKKQEDKT